MTGNVGLITGKIWPGNPDSTGEFAMKAKRVLSILFMAMAMSLLTLRATAAEPATAAPAALQFKILHTNDLHAHDEAFVEKGRNVGGMARIAHLIRAERAKNPNVLAIDAGDIFQGTSFFRVYHGAIEIEMLNQAGYDIYTIGNHEFDDGVENLAKHLKNARFSVINSNIDASKMPELAATFKPSVVKTINGQRVGFVGAIVPNLTEVSLKTDGVKMKAIGSRWADPINEEVARLKSQGIDKIILVTHTGLELDRELATNPDVDIIVGGHSHTRLNKPVVVKHEDGSSALIVQTGSYGRTLGDLDLAFDARGQVDLKNTKYHLINIDDRIPQDQDITAYLAEKSKPFAHLRNTVAGVAHGDFDNSFRRFPCDSPLGNLIADALADGGKQYGATIAFQNRGGIRGRIDRGIITQEKVEEILPFENHLIIATISGDTLLKALENSVSGNLGARFFDVHGMKLAYDSSKPSGDRIVYAQAEDTAGNWGKVDKKKTYRIATNDYSFHGGEGYDFSTATDVVDTGKRLSEYFSKYLIKTKHVKPRSQARIIPVISNTSANKQKKRARRYSSYSRKWSQ